MNLKNHSIVVSIDPCSTIMTELPEKLVFIDIETTGASLRTDRIIEIGILRVENNQVIESFKTLINPGRYIPPEITLLTGITSADLEGAPSFFDIKDKLLELVDGAYFVAHNVRFDYGFIKNEFKLLGYPFSAKQICTVKLSRNLFPQYSHHNLDSIIERFGFKIKNRHRAYDDAEILWKFFKHCLNNFKTDHLIDALNKTTKRPSLPIRIAEEILDQLPETPGVYIFFGEGGCPLYIGKSINIRERVLSHFSSDTISSKEMKISQQIESIEAIPTEGELGALLKESFLIKKMQPLYNRKLRYSRKMLVLKINESTHDLTIGVSTLNRTSSVVGKPTTSQSLFYRDKNQTQYHTCSFGIEEQIDPNELDLIIGVFRSKKSIQEFLIHFAKQFNLCEKLLGIDNSTLACFGYRLGKCNGACIGKENPLQYNLRFIQAFTNHKFKKWPFENPIIIEDISSDGSSKDSFYVDNWCVLGTYNNESQNIDPYEDVGFDLDTYKILSSFLLKQSNQKWIKVLKNTTKLESNQDLEHLSEFI